MMGLRDNYIAEYNNDAAAFRKYTTFVTSEVQHFCCVHTPAMFENSIEDDKKLLYKVKKIYLR